MADTSRPQVRACSVEDDGGSLHWTVLPQWRRSLAGAGGRNAVSETQPAAEKTTFGLSRCEAERHAVTLARLGPTPGASQQVGPCRMQQVVRVQLPGRGDRVDP